jgi:hypothetical protein
LIKKSAFSLAFLPPYDKSFAFKQKSSNYFGGFFIFGFFQKFLKKLLEN